MWNRSKGVNTLKGLYALILTFISVWYIRTHSAGSSWERDKKQVERGVSKADWKCGHVKSCSKTFPLVIRDLSD